MKDKENKSNTTSFAIIGFVAGVLTVILVVLATRGC